MIALLKKDVYTLTQQMKVILLIIIVFACVPGLSASAFAIVYAGMLPLTALAYDERAKWDSLAVMMPYSPTSLVFSKYLLGYLAVFVVSIVSVAAQLIIAAVKGGVSAGESIVSSLTLLAVALMMLALVLPIIFAMGVEKGRIAFFVLVFAIMGAVMLLGSKISAAKLGLDSDISLAPLLLGAMAVAVVLNIISVFVSVAFYKKRLRS